MVWAWALGQIWVSDMRDSRGQGREEMRCPEWKWWLSTSRPREPLHGFLQRPPPQYPAFPLVLLFGFFLHWAVSMSQDFIRSSIHFLSQHLLSIYCVPLYFIHGAKVQAHSLVILALYCFSHFLNTTVFYSWSGLQPFLSIPLDGEEVMPFLFHFSGWCAWVRLHTAVEQVLASLVVLSVESTQAVPSPPGVHTPYGACLFYSEWLISASAPALSLQFWHFLVTGFNLTGHVFSALDLDLLSPIFIFQSLLPSPHNTDVAQTDMYIHEFSHSGHSLGGWGNSGFLQRVQARGEFRLWPPDARASLPTFCISSSWPRVWCTVGAWLITGETESGPVCMPLGGRFRAKKKSVLY